MNNSTTRFFVLLFMVFTLFVGCSKDEDSSDSVVQQGGEIFRSQIVAVNMGSIDLTEENYNGIIAGLDVELLKTENDKLLFMVPSDAPLGNHDLTISGLNYTVRYEVKNTVLTAGAAEVISGLTQKMNAFAATLDNSPRAVGVQNTINKFNSAFDSASDADKIVMATVYQANKAAFDNIIEDDYSWVTGRSIDPADIKLLGKHSYAVYALAAGALVAIYAPGAEKIVGFVLTGVGAYKALTYFDEIATRKLNTVTLAAEDIMGINNRSASSALEFDDNVAKVVAFEAVTRPFIAADAAKTQPKVVDFFKGYNRYNYLINLVNNAITWANNNLPFVDFDLIDLEQIPASVAQTEEAVTATVFSNMTFSVDHPNLTLVSSSLLSTGQLRVKIKIEGTPPSLPIQSFLHYQYSDETSSFTGKLPIKVSNVAAPTGNLNFTMSGVTYNTPVWFLQPSDPGVNCLMRLGYKKIENPNLTIQVVFDLGNFFEQQPVGTVFHFQSGVALSNGFEFTPCQGNFVHFQVYFDDNDPMTVDLLKDTLSQRGTLTKTGTNSFSFSGEVGVVDGNPQTGFYVVETETVQISGSGTF